MSIVGVDIGGTNITLALAGDGGIIVEKRLDTLSRLGMESVLERLLGAIRELLGTARAAEHPAAALGLACPGILDQQARTVVYSPNLDWHNLPLASILEAELGLPVFMENDANLYALGEYAYGAGEGRRDIICLTLGTGVGGGIICNGRILNGQSGWASELGHMIVQPGGRRCGCGASGCLEAYASATGMQAILRDELAKGEYLGGLKPDDGVKLMDMAARGGDALALEIFSQAGFYLGLGIINAILATGIETVILGGGVAKGWDLMSPACWRQIQNSLKIINEKNISIEIARLGQSAPLLGATALARGRLREEICC